MDLQMPGADGTEILETLKQNHKFIEKSMLTVYIASELPAEWITLGTFKNLEKSCDAVKHRRANEKIPMTICQHTVQSNRPKKSLAPNGRTRLPSWHRLLFVLGCAITYLGLWTATPGTHAMQWETLAVRSSHPICGNHCAMALCRLSVPSFKAPVSPNTAVVQWVWNHPMETESLDRESAPVKSTIIHGDCPLGTSSTGCLSFSVKRISSRLYLQKKSLLC